MKKVYLSPMLIMEHIKAIVNLKRQCPICGHAVNYLPKPLSKGMKIVHENEYYSHKIKNGQHFIIRHQPEELQISLC